MSQQRGNGYEGLWIDLFSLLFDVAILVVIFYFFMGFTIDTSLLWAFMHIIEWRSAEYLGVTVA